MISLLNDSDIFSFNIDAEDNNFKVNHQFCDDTSISICAD